MVDYSRFWREFLKGAEDIIPLYQGVAPKDKNYLHTKKGDYKPFCTAFCTKKKQIWIENCIQESGPNGREESNRKFDHFEAQKEKIEQLYGERLEWKRLSDKKRSRICSRPINFDFNDEGSWNTIFKQLWGQMNRFIPAMEYGATGLDSLPRKTTVIRKQNKKDVGYMPTKSDAVFAARQLVNRSSEAILDQIARKMHTDGIKMHPDWRRETKKKITEEWF